MPAVADEAAIRARMHPISVETYRHLGEMGHLSERTELIRGVIIDQTPKSPLHSSIVELLADHIVSSLPPGWIVRCEQPLTLAESEPEPDVAIVRGTRADFFFAHPRSAALVIEVCVTGEELDRVKLGVYAEAGGGVAGARHGTHRRTAHRTAGRGLSPGGTRRLSRRPREHGLPRAHAAARRVVSGLMPF